MLRAFKINQLIGFGICAVSCGSYAQVEAYRESTFSPTQFSAEIKPLPLMLTVLPGITGFGVGTELSAGGNAATFADVYGIYANVPSNMQGDTNGSTPVVQKMKGISADIGGRYYTDRSSSSSWYGGARLSYSFAMGQWSYQGEQINQSVRTLNPGIEGGYRWVLRDKFLLRLGAGLDGNIVQENTATATDRETSVTSDGEGKVKRYANVPVSPRADLGVGYMF